MTETSILTELVQAGPDVYGLGLLFVKALFILLLAQTLAEQFEFSPAVLRHHIWRVAIVCLALLPGLTLLLPRWSVSRFELSAPITGQSATVAQASVGTVAELSSWGTGDYLLLLYLSLVLIGMLRFVTSLWQISTLTLNAVDAEADCYRELARYHTGRVSLKISKDIEGPMTWGRLFPVILLPANYRHWSVQEREMVLRHECGHIARADWLWLLLAQWVMILYWPVPGVRRARRMLSLEAERACDDAVLATGVPAADYAALLLRQARVNRLAATVAFGSSCELVLRIKHIVSAYVDRAGKRRVLRWSSLLAGLLMLPLAAMHATASLPSNGRLAGLKLTPVALRMPAIEPVATPRPPAIERPNRPPQTGHDPERGPQRPHYVSAIERAMVTAAVFSQRHNVSLEQQLAVPSFGSARAISKSSPAYPANAKRWGIEGRVLVEFAIDTEGRVVDAKIIKAQPSSVFNRSVLDAIESYRFEPSRANGRAVITTGLREEFNFQLRRDDPPDRNAGEPRSG